jgi:hypothetical protein
MVGFRVRGSGFREKVEVSGFAVQVPTAAAEADEKC